MRYVVSTDIGYLSRLGGPVQTASKARRFMSREDAAREIKAKRHFATADMIAQLGNMRVEESEDTPDERLAALFARLAEHTFTTKRIEFYCGPRDGGLYFGSFGRRDSAHYNGSHRSGTKGEESGTPGTGARVLSLICRLADMYAKRIDLYTYNESLVRYYQRFGFEVTNEERLEMSRQPRRPT